MTRLLALVLLTLSSVWAKRPIPIKVVVVTMFERGAPTGDQPGEFQFWVEREKLDQIYKFPQAMHDLRGNSSGVLALCTGVGTAKAGDGGSEV